MENNNSNNKTLWWVLGIVVIAIVAIVLLKNKKAEDTVVTDQPAGTEIVEDTTEGSISASSSAMSYQAALTKYADRRIQLTPSCQATPNNVTYKSGTDIMIDNRSASTAKVRLGTAFSIKPYSFKIVHLVSDSLPATYLLDCGASQNVATILLQK